MEPPTSLHNDLAFLAIRSLSRTHGIDLAVLKIVYSNLKKMFTVIIYRATYVALSSIIFELLLHRFSCTLCAGPYRSKPMRSNRMYAAIQYVNGCI